MTRVKKLKKAIRERSRKTGESYTAARRHVLQARQKRTGARASAPDSPPPASRRNPSAGGAVSAAASLKRTGHGLDHWFAVLDAFGAAEEGHTASARHLHADHGVPGWYAQGITVAYERARGLRAVNQASTGRFQVSVSRVVSGSVAEVADAFGSSRRRADWLKGADSGLRAALEAAFTGPKPRSVRIKSERDARLRYPWDGSTVEIRITGKPMGGASVAADNTGLAGAVQVERRRALWKAALEALKAHLSR
jgi:hypothetical protein